jgi:hypothetical protein
VQEALLVLLVDLAALVARGLLVVPDEVQGPARELVDLHVVGEELPPVAVGELQPPLREL